MRLAAGLRPDPLVSQGGAAACKPRGRRGRLGYLSTGATRRDACNDAVSTYVVGEMLHSAREARRVGLQSSLVVAGVGQPAVVDRHVLVASRHEAVGRHPVSHHHQQPLSEHTHTHSRRHATGLYMST